MIPAFLAKPEIKWGLVAVVFAAYTAIIFNQGMDYVQDQWDASIARQAAESVRQVASEAKVSVSAAVDTAKREQQDRENLKKLERKVVQNAHDAEKPCVLDPGYVAVRDELVGVLNEAVERVPTPDAPAGEPDGLRAEGNKEAESVPRSTEPVEQHPIDQQPLTTDEAAQQDLEIAADLLQCRTKYAGLKQYELGTYIVRKAFYDQRPEGEER